MFYFCFLIFVKHNSINYALTLGTGENSLLDTLTDTPEAESNFKNC
jgi:hypothetical protein